MKSAMRKTWLAVFVLCALVLAGSIASVHAYNSTYISAVNCPDEVTADCVTGAYNFRATITVVSGESWATVLPWLSAPWSNVEHSHPWGFGEAPTEYFSNNGSYDVPVEQGFRGNLVAGADVGTVTVNVRYPDDPSDPGHTHDFVKTVTIRRNCPEGGNVVPVDKFGLLFGLLAPYFGLALTAMIVSAVAVATAVYVKRVKHREEKR